MNFEQGVDDSSFVQGKLRLNFSFWRDDIQASAFVLDIIEHGSKIFFKSCRCPILLTIGLPRFDMMLLLAELVMSCLSVVVSEKYLVIQIFAILCMLPSSLQGNFVLF